MTIEEAITQLKMDRDLCNFNPMTGEEEPMNEDCRKTAEALDIAIKALEQEPCKEAVSRKKIEKLKRYRFSYDSNTTIPKSDLFVKLTDLRDLPSVAPARKLEQESYEDAISRRAVLRTLDNMDSALDDNRTVETYKELLTACYKDLPSVTSVRKKGK